MSIINILTKAQFASIAESKAGLKGLRSILLENQQETRILKDTSIFLSHSHSDKVVVEQAVVFFRGLGISVYVDWADETMPDKPNGITAQKIKDQIKKNDKFILLATNNAIASKWCNWEVGIGDIRKFQSNKIAIFPLADNDRSWDGNEYLQIYPRIQQGFKDKNEYFIWYPDGTLEEITEWLKR